MRALERLERRVLFAAGDMEPLFNNATPVTIELGQPEVLLGTGVTPDGDIIVVGRSPEDLVFLTKLDFTGAVVPAYGNGGTIRIADDPDLIARRMVFDPATGRVAVVVDGPSDRIYLFDSDGQLDDSFDADGILEPFGPFQFINLAAFDTQGRLIISVEEGLSHQILRILPDGAIDSTFNPADQDGALVNLLPLADGNLVVVYDDNVDPGTGPVLFSYAQRLLSDGSVDTTFSDPTLGGSEFGYDAVDLAEAPGNHVLVLGARRIVVGSAEVKKFFQLQRITPAGTADSTFGENGSLSLAMPPEVVSQTDPIPVEPLEVMVQDDGKIIVIGRIQRASIAEGRVGFWVGRYHSNGILDTTFGQRGFAFSGSNEAIAAATGMIAPDGDIVVAADTILRQIDQGSDDVVVYKFQSGAGTMGPNSAHLLENGVLDIGGTGSQDIVSLVRRGGDLHVRINAETFSYLYRDVKSIVIHTGSRHDQVSIGPFIRGAIVLGGPGDDTIQGGIYNDTLIGGLGSDDIYARAGNDLVYGGDPNQPDALDGNDFIRGQEGNDTLYGQAGDDRLYGDEGNDRLVAGAGFNVLNGGTGFDSIQSLNRRKDHLAIADSLDSILKDDIDFFSAVI